jgi:hypothetical protein
MRAPSLPLLRHEQGGAGECYTPLEARKRAVIVGAGALLALYRIRTVIDVRRGEYPVTSRSSRCDESECRVPIEKDDTGSDRGTGRAGQLETDEAGTPATFASGPRAWTVSISMLKADEAPLHRLTPDAHS